MNPIEFPNNDHYYLTLAEEAFSAGNNLKALENYKLAYRENPSAKLNHLIASLALEQGNFAEALEFSEEKSDSYLEAPETIDIYLQIQLYSYNFFAAREFLWRAKKMKRLTEEQRNIWLMRIEDQEAFYQKQQQAIMKQLESEISQLPLLSSMEQLISVRKIKQLPEERLQALAKKFMLEPKVAPLVRSYLFESLARIGVSDKVRYLTVLDEIVELSPTTTGLDETLQNEISTHLDECLGDEDPTLLANILEQVKLEMAFLYPLQGSFKKTKAWVTSYLSEYCPEYRKGSEVLDQRIETMRKKIKQLMFDYH